MKLLAKNELDKFYLDKLDEFYEGELYHWDYISEKSLEAILDYLKDKKKNK